MGFFRWRFYFVYVYVGRRIAGSRVVLREFGFRVGGVGERVEDIYL